MKGYLLAFNSSYNVCNIGHLMHVHVQVTRHKYVKSNEVGNDKESIQSNITPDPGHNMGK